MGAAIGIGRRLRRLVGRPVRRVLNNLGYDVVPLSSTLRGPDLRLTWIERLGVDVVVDVGANEGQFVGWMRDRGYRGSIISFEPQSRAFAACEARWKSDPGWHGFRVALGETDAELTMQIAGNSVSSSLLPMLRSHVDALPASAIVATETVPVRRLDELLVPLIGDAERLYLKLDVQGYEPTVLKGATGILERTALLELELSLVPLYADQALLPEMMAAVEALGFVPLAIEPGFVSETDGRLLQVDGIFVRRDLLNTHT